MQRKTALNIVVAELSGEKDRITKEFIKEYNKIMPSSGNDFNLRKTTKNVWQTVAKYNSLKKWVELRDYLNLPKYERKIAIDTEVKTRVIFDDSVFDR